MELVGRQEDASGLLQEFSADVPAAAFAELVVEHLEEEAGALLLARAGQGARDADEIVDVGRVPTHGGKPFPLESVEIAFRELLLCIS